MRAEAMLKRKEKEIMSWRAFVPGREVVISTKVFS